MRSAEALDDQLAKVAAKPNTLEPDVQQLGSFAFRFNQVRKVAIVSALKAPPDNEHC